MDVDWGKTGTNPRKSPNFGEGDGDTFPPYPGDTSGRGQPKIRGFNEGKSPKFIDLRGGDEGAILGDFVHPSCNDLKNSTLLLRWAYCISD